MTSNQEQIYAPCGSVVKEKMLSFIGYKKSRFGKKKKKKRKRSRCVSNRCKYLFKRKNVWGQVHFKSFKTSSRRMLHFERKKAQSKLVSFVNGVCCCCPMLGLDKAFNLSMQFMCILSCLELSVVKLKQTKAMTIRNQNRRRKQNELIKILSSSMKRGKTRARKLRLVLVLLRIG